MPWPGIFLNWFARAGINWDFEILLGLKSARAVVQYLNIGNFMTNISYYNFKCVE